MSPLESPEEATRKHRFGTGGGAVSETRRGTVARLRLEDGYGYVVDVDDRGSYFFRTSIIVNREARRGLRVGSSVRFKVSDDGSRVIALEISDLALAPKPGLMARVFLWACRHWPWRQ